MHVRLENKFDDKQRDFQLKINQEKCIDNDMTVKEYLLELLDISIIFSKIQLVVYYQCCILIA